MVEYIKNNIVKKIFPRRDDNAHKGSFWKILNIAGSINYSGAAYLSSVSALKSGAGFLSLACPDIIINRIAPSMPEVTYIPLKTANEGCISSDNSTNYVKNYDVISIGCGLSVKENTINFFKKLLSEITGEKKLIIDADGINILAKLNDNFILKNAIITPHPMELSRFLKVDIKEILDNREKYARITAEKYECVIVLKGHETIIADINGIYKNTSGNSALAKAGSGDVLTGVIAGMLSQHLSLSDAAKVGVYLHGLAGEIASEDLTKYSVLASDVINYIPFAIQEILSEEE